MGLHYLTSNYFRIVIRISISWWKCQHTKASKMMIVQFHILNRHHLQCTILNLIYLLFVLQPPFLLRFVWKRSFTSAYKYGCVVQRSGALRSHSRRELAKFTSSPPLNATAFSIDFTPVFWWIKRMFKKWCKNWY